MALINITAMVLSKIQNQIPCTVALYGYVGLATATASGTVPDTEGRGGVRPHSTPPEPSHMPGGTGGHRRGRPEGGAGKGRGTLGSQSGVGPVP